MRRAGAVPRFAIASVDVRAGAPPVDPASKRSVPGSSGRSGVRAAVSVSWGVVLRTHLCSLGETTADELRWSRGEPGCPCLEITPVGPPALGALGQLLEAGAETEIVGEFRLLAGESQEPPWVLGLPTALTPALAAIEEHDVGRLADAWAATLEPGAALTSADAHRILRDLLRFAGGHPGPLCVLVTGGRADVP
jgi:hypothetical protein